MKDFADKERYSLCPRPFTTKEKVMIAIGVMIGVPVLYGLFVLVLSLPELIG